MTPAAPAIIPGPPASKPTTEPTITDDQIPTSGFNPINAEYAAEVGIVARETTTPERTSRENCRGGDEVRAIDPDVADDDDDEVAVKTCEVLRRLNDVVLENEDTFAG